MNGCVAALSVDNGKVIDIEVMSSSVLSAKSFRRCKKDWNMIQKKQIMFANAILKVAREKWNQLVHPGSLHDR